MVTEFKHHKSQFSSQICFSTILNREKMLENYHYHAYGYFNIKFLLNK